MPSITLADIRAAADKKYGPTSITLSDSSVVNLINPLRLPKERRAALVAKQDELDTDTPEQDQLDQLADTVRLVAESHEQADRLLAEIGDDLGTMAELIAEYTKEHELGEASPSAA